MSPNKQSLHLFLP